MNLPVLIISMFLTGLIAASIARRKENSICKAFFLGFFLSIWGVHYAWSFQDDAPEIGNDI